MAIDATVAGASANSYLTVADADAFAASDIGRNAEAWASATVEKKEAALIRATLDVDDEIGRVNRPASVDQALLFPRYDDLTPPDYTTLRLPFRLRRATYLQAAYVLKNANVIDEASAFRARGLTSFANPDGTGGTLADDPMYGRVSPDVRKMLGEFAEGAIIATIVKR